MKAKLELEMPRGCYCCPLLHDPGDSAVRCRGVKELNWRGELAYKKFKYGTDLEVRQNWCPLQSVIENTEVYYTVKGRPDK